jgi:hypothetical protein
MFDGLWQRGESEQRGEGSLGRQGNEGSSCVSSGWPRYMRIRRFEGARIDHGSSY